MFISYENIFIKTEEEEEEEDKTGILYALLSS